MIRKCGRKSKLKKGIKYSDLDGDNGNLYCGRNREKRRV